MGQRAGELTQGGQPLLGVEVAPGGDEQVIELFEGAVLLSDVGDGLVDPGRELGGEAANAPNHLVEAAAERGQLVIARVADLNLQIAALDIAHGEGEALDGSPDQPQKKEVGRQDEEETEDRRHPEKDPSLGVDQLVGIGQRGLKSDPGLIAANRPSSR